MGCTEPGVSLRLRPSLPASPGTVGFLVLGVNDLVRATNLGLSALPGISRLMETETDKKTEVRGSGGRVAADQRLSCFGGRYFRFPAADARRGRAVLGLRRLIASPASR